MRTMSTILLAVCRSVVGGGLVSEVAPADDMINSNRDHRQVIDVHVA